MINQSFWFLSCEEQSKGGVKPFFLVRNRPKEELNLFFSWGTVQRRSWTFLSLEEQSKWGLEPFFSHQEQSKGGVEPFFLVCGQSEGRLLVWVQSEGGVEPLGNPVHLKHWAAAGQRTGISTVLRVDTPVTTVLESCSWLLEVKFRVSES